MRERLTSIIVDRLKQESERLSRDFHQQKSIQTRFAALDDVLPKEIAADIYNAFPAVEAMRLLRSQLFQSCG